MVAMMQANGAATDKKKDENENLWSAILGEVQKQGSTKLPSNKSLLVLGDNASGKTTLIAKLQGVEDPKKGSGLEYAYIDVRDEYREDSTRLGVWVLDGDPGHTNLLKFALNEANFSNTLVILTVSMSTPWSWLDQVQHWMKVLSEHIEKLTIGTDERETACQHLEKAWQSYHETGVDDLEPSSPMKASKANRLSSVEDEMDALPLPEGVLTTNLGVDIVICVTKTDFMSTLEKEFDYRDEHFDFMQQWIRRFCLQYGASLFYTSVKEDKNCDLLYKYLTHRMYGFPFRTPALVVEKDAVLIPAGWDNLKKISILYENMASCKAEDYYCDIIVEPPSRKIVSNRELEVQTEDEQAFLAKQQQILQQQGQVPARGESPMRTPTSQKTRTSTGSGGSPKKMDVKINPGTPSGEGVLANFFNSLLHKKTGSPGGGPSSLNSSGNGGSPRTSNGPGTDAAVDKLSVRTDAAAELDRLTKSVRKDVNVEFQSSDC